MLQEIKLVLKENDEMLETIKKETSTKPAHLVKSLEEFQKNANAIITKMIENQGESGHALEIEDDEESSDEDANERIPVSPKKRRK